ncbi:transporter [Bacillus safensis]|uniref:Putative transporter n=2 Tax=Bacillaceae TaxID=186817 RepID=A0A5C0WLR6_BACIA|nr:MULTISPECIES: MFS transporter [Bacillus]KAB3541537.1 MFS transporter [Bacillus safensis]KAB3546780.1 MFS transporter [Bacillus safensis]MBG9825096.1 transporter [Bacillus safensis]MBG9834742.1 transporter [Bacillus safensis]MBG9860870.1 transporter [Bacillus safensis]
MVKDKMTPRDHPNMNFRLKPESKMSHYMALLFAAACGMAVANIYFAQPLLNSLADEFGITYSSIGIVITITQLCYAAGLLLIVPLGDLLNRRRLIIGQMLLSVLALILVGIAPIVTVLFLGLAVVGLLAVVTQVLVAFAASWAAPEERGRIVGLVQSGIVTGILLARTFAGVLTDFAGWRSVYLVSAVIMLILTGVLFRVLPRDDSKRESLSYVHLLRSMFILFIQERILRIRGILALLIFIVFGTLWTSLVLPLSTPPYSLSHTAIGAFGLAGAAGALGAARAGSLADRGFGQFTTGIALVLLFISWFFISLTEHSLIALVIGIILLDLSVQAVHVTNQSMIFTVRAEARSRLTAAYMIFYSIGSATGSIVSTSIYATYGWGGVCLFGASISALAILYWFITYRLTKHITVVSQTK